MTIYYHEAEGFTNKQFLEAFRYVWQAGNHVGQNRPVARAYIRTVRISRLLRSVGQDEIFGYVPGGGGKGAGLRDVWKGIWKAQSAWRPLPNIKSFKVDQDYEQNGVMQCVMDIDNVFMEPHGSGDSLYHKISRGYFSPLRGFKPDGRPRVGDADENEWFDMLKDKSTQVVIVAGYGDLVVPCFTGLLNDHDSTSRPDVITLTLRDAGQLYTDQQIFANSKIKYVDDPVTFADRRSAYNETEVAYAAEASSSEPGSPPRLVFDDGNASAWVSRGNDHASAMEWIEISVKNGYYGSFKLHPAYAGMEMYVAVKAKGGNANPKKHILNTPLAEDEWVDEGKGNIPGTNIPYVRHFENVKGKSHETQFPDYGYDLGDDSRIRLYFSNLPLKFHGGVKEHRAAVYDFRALSRDIKAEAAKADWILVDDAADCVRLVFQWCGINAMEVEDTGARLRKPLVFNRGNFLVDIIKRISEMTNYVFYMKPPPSFDENDLSKRDWESMGTGVFRQNQAMKKGRGLLDPVEYVHEDQQMTGISPKFSDEPLPYNIRVRGRVIQGEEKSKKLGRTLGADHSRRFMYVYRPPWSRDQHYGGNWPSSDRDQYRNGNVKRYVVHHDDTLKTLNDCKIAALFIAFAEALESAQVQVECPAMPFIYLDHQTAIFDTASGMSTRVWVASRSMEFVSGEQGHFTMALAGAMLDLPDIQTVREELNMALRDSSYDPGLSTWELENAGPHYDTTKEGLPAPPWNPGVVVVND